MKKEEVGSNKRILPFVHATRCPKRLHGALDSGGEDDPGRDVRSTAAEPDRKLPTEPIDVRELLTQNLANHVAIRNHKLRHDYFLSYYAPPGRLRASSEGRDTPGEDTDEDEEKKKRAPCEGAGGGGRTTSFSVEDILDPRKFTGRPMAQEDDSSSERPDEDEEDEDNAYISGELRSSFDR